jgi:hypothetical protein
MALKKTSPTKFGFDIPNAYIRIEGVRIINKFEIKFQVRSYVTVENAHFNDVEYSCSYDIDGKNPLKQAYEYLKTLPEFDGAIDC